MIVSDTIAVGPVECREICEIQPTQDTMSYALGFSPSYLSIGLASIIAVCLWVILFKGLKGNKHLRLKLLVLVVLGFGLINVIDWCWSSGDFYSILLSVILLVGLFTLAALSLYTSQVPQIASFSQKSPNLNKQRRAFLRYFRKRRIRLLERKSKNLWKMREDALIDPNVFWQQYERLVKKMKYL
ncbi:hypothetical protein BKI52_01395 [marine bacterium AO1-C]|nr:hypothetical protein BKI52_01395 [marine bacterium AO1-C]